MLPQAAAGRPTGAGNPEGQRLLTEAAAALRATHVEFAHQAHQDLLEVGGWCCEGGFTGVECGCYSCVRVCWLVGDLCLCEYAFRAGEQ